MSSNVITIASVFSLNEVMFLKAPPLIILKVVFLFSDIPVPYLTHIDLVEAGLEVKCVWENV